VRAAYGNVKAVAAAAVRKSFEVLQERGGWEVPAGAQVEQLKVLQLWQSEEVG